MGEVGKNVIMPALLIPGIRGSNVEILFLHFVGICAMLSYRYVIIGRVKKPNGMTSIFKNTRQQADARRDQALCPQIWIKE